MFLCDAQSRSFVVRGGGRGLWPSAFARVFAEWLSDISKKGRDTMFIDCEDFCGTDCSVELNRTIRDFFELAADMRSRLGEQAYLLDSHLRMILEAVAIIPLTHESRVGLGIGSELNGMIRRVTQGEPEEANPLYEKVKAYIEEHPLPWRESYTRHSMYFAALLGDYAEGAAKEYRQKLAEHIRSHTDFDAVKLRELRRRVCELLGGEADMQRLEDLFRQGFLSVMPMSGFAQGVSDALLSVITSRDEETSKLIFQLMLDANLAYEE